MNRLYFDHNASSPLRPALRERICSRLQEDVGNPGSLHREGQRARSMVEQARAKVLASIQGQQGVLTFTSGATEANNIALQSLRAGDVLVTSRLEHPSIRDTAGELEERGVTLRWLDHDPRGRLSLRSLEAALDGASMIALTAANNELGNINEIKEIGVRCAAAGVALHVDAAQVWGRWPLQVEAGVSSLTLSAHKAGGPIGVGALWVDRPDRYRPLTLGGQQERGRRAGTENVAFIDAMGALAQHAEPAWAALLPLRDRLAAGLEALGGLRNGDPDRALPNTLNISFIGTEAEEMVMALDLEGVAISAGSACTAGSMEVSAVIDALGFDTDRSVSALRWSLGPGLDTADVDAAIEIARRVLERVRS